MKTAIALNGNLRSFFMPLPENSQLRVCDFFVKNVIEPNGECDIFICCGLSDFFMDGKVFYINNTIETTNNNGFRVHNNIEFIDKELAKSMISRKLNETFKNIKSLIFIDDNYEAHPNFLKMKNCGFFGIAPELLINQHDKILKLKESIENSNITYDYIIRSRFDFIIKSKVVLSNYNIKKSIVYCAGFEGDKDLIYDWYAFGNSETILKCMDLYNELDFINPLYALRCNKCGLKFIKEKNTCIHGTNLQDVTLSSETQLARLLKNNNFLAEYSHINGFVYRYNNDSSETVKDTLPKNLKDVKIIDYTATGEIFISEYT
jgi:hypothetical protein